MGASWTKNAWFNAPSSLNKDGKSTNNNSRSEPKQARIDPRRLATQFVYYRRGSMFIDEDGDVAHEFYEEFKVDNSHTTEMRRKLVNLRPEGNVPYSNPRLHKEFPIPMYSPLELDK